MLSHASERQTSAHPAALDLSAMTEPALKTAFDRSTLKTDNLHSRFAAYHKVLAAAD